MARLQQTLLGWYEACRRDLPWRRTRDPYAIWVSEIMLQQTRVETVIPYYERFLSRFPTAMALAEAPPDEVLAMWSGLGYYRRARLLLEGARAVAAKGGALPAERAGLVSVPGIGRYTAGAIASIAFGEPVGLVDGNVARVFARVFAIDEDMRKQGMRTAEALADAIVAERDPGAWNQALMELGATVCTPRSPSCDACPLSRASMCRAHREGRVAELPVLSAKKPPEARRMQAIVAIRPRDGAVLMLRRRAERTFGGLWEPPTIEGAPRMRKVLASWLPIDARTLERVGTVEHVLTHRALSVDVARAELTSALAPRDLPDDAGYDAVRVVRPVASREGREEGMGVSTLAKKILARATQKTP
ncbi:MAG: A/G-specific adenine glycosylase [Labilithrix sp.]|nr:A/G-specific adenine glycosylase [Labilithrix sp.]